MILTKLPKMRMGVSNQCWRYEKEEGTSKCLTGVAHYILVSMLSNRGTLSSVMMFWVPFWLKSQLLLIQSLWFLSLLIQNLLITLANFSFRRFDWTWHYLRRSPSRTCTNVSKDKVSPTHFRTPNYTDNIHIAVHLIEFQVGDLFCWKTCM